MTQEQLAYIVDRAPRTIMYHENDGQHPSFNTFYQLVTMFDISVDQYFYPSKNKGSECRKRIDAMLNSLDEKELKIVEATIQAMKAAKETEDAEEKHAPPFFHAMLRRCAFWQAIRVWPHSEIFAGRRPAKMLVGELPKPAGLRDKLSQSPGAMRLLSAACRYRSWALFSRPSVTPSR